MARLRDVFATISGGESETFAGSKVGFISCHVHAAEQHCGNCLRLFALNWLVSGLVYLITAITMTSSFQGHVLSIWLSYLPAVLLFIFALLFWILAPPVARLVRRGADHSVSIGSLSRCDLYTFAFVFLGLFFVLSDSATAPRDHAAQSPQGRNFYQLSRASLTFAAGLVSLLGAPHFTKKLARRGARTQPSSGGEATT